MPIYEYACSDCNTKFELLRPLSKATDPAPCPKCRKGAKRVMSTFACFSTDSSGFNTPVAGAGGGCASCGSSNCSTCGM